MIFQRLDYIFHNGHNSRLVYMLRSFARYAVPKTLLRRRLTSLLCELGSRADKEYILSRVDYYNKLASPPRPCGSSNRQADLCRGHALGEFTYRRRPKPTAYFFDAYEYTRYFSDGLRWHYLFGDVTHVPDVPSIVKSRPVGGDNACSVLLNLDKNRHFCFLHDRIRFEDKTDRLIFRAYISYKPHRIRFFERYFDHPMCDLGECDHACHDYPAWHKPKISFYAQLRYKFILALEGNDVATNLKWIMSSNSIAVMPRPRYETWFMEGRLIPDYHYIAIRDDYSDLEERLQYYIDHPDKAREIVAHANEYIRQFADSRRERLISLLTLDKYFSATDPDYRSPAESGMQRH